MYAALLIDAAASASDLNDVQLTPSYLKRNLRGKQPKGLIALGNVGETDVDALCRVLLSKSREGV